MRLVPDGALTPRLWQAAAGSRVRLGAPKGTFTLQPGDPRPHLLVASGTGLAPFVAMIRALASTPRPPRLILVHGVARVVDLTFRDELAGLALGGAALRLRADRLARGRPRQPPVGGGRTGRAEQVLPAVLDAWGVNPAGAVAYRCGNPGMVGAAGAALAVAGVPPADIHAEEFWGPGATASASRRGSAADAPDRRSPVRRQIPGRQPVRPCGPGRGTRTNPRPNPLDMADHAGCTRRPIVARHRPQQ